MRLNENTAVSSSRLLFVPYDAHHVPTYHEWMSDPAIQEATASEPLTLEEEYENQISWRTSGDKLTFILCLLGDTSTTTTDLTTTEDPSGSRREGQEGDVAAESTQIYKAGIVDTPARMIGDINLFLTPCDDDDDEDNDGDEDSTTAASNNHNNTNNNSRGRANRMTYLNGEIDIMIASPAHRKRGYGREAVSTLLTYIRRHTGQITAEYAAFADSIAAAAASSSSTTKSESTAGGQQFVLRDLVAKINAGNQGSIALFQKLGFKQRGEVNYFGEVLLVLQGFCHGVENVETKAEALYGYEELRWDRAAI